MKHNKENLRVGERVVLDKSFRNSSEVTIKSISPLGAFAEVYNDNPEDSWEVMTYRLTRKTFWLHGTLALPLSSNYTRHITPLGFMYTSTLTANIY